ncbi:MAG: hypothetical protein NC225_11975 [Clostridium sp.]|nr:hypothetical protein [Clostridium sp.]MCM1460946.1 hypothetical protein [Bacteroides sp.]
MDNNLKKYMMLDDYTGKLNSHIDYLKIIKLLEEKSEYIEYVLVDEDNMEMVDKFKEFIVSVQTKRKWWGTKSAQCRKVYKIKVSKELFRYLQRFETFCKFVISDCRDFSEETDFGINDIAFFDKNELPLLFTTTHEGYIMIRNDLFL